MEIGTGDLGCSVKELCVMDNARFYGGGGGEWNEGVDVYTTKGLQELLRELKNNGKGGICIWADTSASDDPELMMGEEDKSGKTFYAYLKKKGHHVYKTESYKNPGHTGMCTLYYWFFRKKPRPASDIGRKAVVKEAPPTPARVAIKPKRAAVFR